MFITRNIASLRTVALRFVERENDCGAGKHRGYVEAVRGQGEQTTVLLCQMRSGLNKSGGLGKSLTSTRSASKKKLWPAKRELWDTIIFLQVAQTQAGMGEISSEVGGSRTTRQVSRKVVS